MSVLQIVLLVLLVLVAVLLVGGFIANRRRFDAEDAVLRKEIEEANEQLALARAEDKGWDRALMEAAAREALGPAAGAPLELVQVVDRPGTEADEAVFRAGDRRVVLGREGDRWVAR